MRGFRVLSICVCLMALASGCDRHQEERIPADAEVWFKPIWPPESSGITLSKEGSRKFIRIVAEKPKQLSMPGVPTSMPAASFMVDGQTYFWYGDDWITRGMISTGHDDFWSDDAFERMSQHQKSKVHDSPAIWQECIRIFETGSVGSGKSDAQTSQPLSK